MSSGSSQCPQWKEYPYITKGTVGGFVGFNLIVCGGSHINSDECYFVTPQKIEFLAEMSVKRKNAASLVIGGKYLWVSGGNNVYTLSSTEFIETKAMPGPELPTALEGHKMIDITDDLTLFIGGKDASGGVVTATFYFDHNRTHYEIGQWSFGPTMQYRRKNHAVGVVTDRTTLKKLVVVTGGVGEEGSAMTSEILSEDLWSKGDIAYRNLLKVIR